MNFEPSKFFIGLIDFFSILLPGALFTYVIKDRFFSFVHITKRPFDFDVTEHSVIFLFVSYLLGHFIFLIGAKFLDDFLYEKISAAQFSKQVELILLEKRLSNKLMRWLADHFFKVYSDRSLKKVSRIKTHYLSPLDASETINVFQWSKTRLNLKHQSALMEVQQHEANSKFFRSLIVVFCFLIPWSLWFHRWDLSLSILPLLILASWRYIEQRMKAVRLAYWYIISIEAANPNGFREHRNKAKNKCTHAGGIVFKGTGKTKKYLLVKTKKPPYVWVFPKGHIEAGETSDEAAIREVKEETGVWAKISEQIGTSQFVLDKEMVKVDFFLMESLEVGDSPEGRSRKWLLLDDAIKALEHKENKRLLGSLKSQK